jgi:hypothetical protein
VSIDNLRQVEALQKLDMQLDELRREADALPGRLDAIRNQLEDAKEAVASERQRLLENEQLQRHHQAQMQSDRDRIKKWEGRLGEIKTPREYAALSREVEIAKKGIKQEEEETLAVMESAEAIKKVLTDKEIAFAQRETVEKGEGAQIKARLEGLAAELTRLQELRAAEARKCEPKLLARYEGLRRRTGLVLVPVVGGSCKGCNMSIRPQLYNQLRTSTLIAECPSCRRLIYAIERVQDAAAAQG